MNSKVDTYLLKVKKWQDEMEQLRNILLDCELEEEFKWYHPCYTFRGQNIVLIHGFKEYCALLFFKGALLQDEAGILVQQTKSVQSARQLRFTEVKEIIRLKKTIKAYIYEAIEVEKAGLKVTFKKTVEYEVPEEFTKAMKKNPALKKAFNALTPGRQKAYLLHFSEPKQSKTRESRIEKCTKMILKGKGLHDDYIKKKK
jgi:uncharacterized protein YdeI (YjbR/CyaY-like superfamily)